MQFVKLLSIVLFVFQIFNSTFPQEKPSITYNDLLISTELNPSLRYEARALAAKLDLPLSIYLPQGIFIEALGVENNRPVYSLIENLAHPFEGGKAIFIEEVLSSYDLIEARVHYGDGRVSNPTLGYSTPSAGSGLREAEFLMIPDWTADKVMTFNVNNGDLIDANFVPSNSPNMQSPKEALVNSSGYITVSDQISDLVQKYDTSGVYLGFLAPAGGVSTTILDNMRGHNYRPNGNLVVCVGSGGNQNSIPQFDPSGNYLGQFITTGSGGIASPFDIIFRTNDLLVTTSTSPGVYRFTHNGAPINVMISGLSFAQQIQELSDTRLAVIEFSGTGSGIRLYDSSGTFIKVLSGVTGNRGVYQLRNGNFLTTNSAGVNEIDSSSGALVRTVVSGVNAQYVTPFDPDLIIPVELVSFTAEEFSGSVQLNWKTATEKNNYGFDVERISMSGSSIYEWRKIGFVQGNGTTTNASAYNFIDNDVAAGNYKYRLKQIDLDGSFNYSHAVETDVSGAKQFVLMQNYPNPFNPSTTISWQIPVQGFVTLKIFDVLGNELATLVNEVKDPGFYSSIFSTESLQFSSGVYFYQLRSGNFVSTKKFILTK